VRAVLWTNFTFGKGRDLVYRLVVAGIVSMMLVFALHKTSMADGHGTLMVGLESDLRSFDIWRANSFGSSGAHIASAIMEPLLDRSEDGSYLPVLAKSWTVSANKLAWTFKLRQGVKFHDGNSFSAQDVAFHFKRLLSSKNKSAIRSVLAPIRKVEATGRFTVRFVLRKPWPGLLRTLAARSSISLIPPFGAVKSGKHHRKPVGTGPFRFVSWKNNHRLIVEENPDYWVKGQPKLARVIFDIEQNEALRFANLRAGKLDIVQGRLASHIDAAVGQSAVNTLVYDGPGAEVILLNTSRKPLNDWRVRQAIAHAWDQKSIIEEVYGNHILAVSNPFQGLFECGDVAFRKYDIKKSRKLVAAYGQPVRLEYVHTGSQISKLLATTFKAQMKKAGIKVRLSKLSEKQHAKSVFSKNFMSSSWRIVGDVDQATQMAALTGSTSAYNLTGIRNDKIDALNAAIASSNNPRKREKNLCNIVKTLNEEAVLLWQGGQRLHTFVRSRVRGMTESRVRVMLFHNVGVKSS
jgi:ABC-type transport system substrate-binding protein